MPDKYRKFIIILIVAGLALSALSATSICNFGGCTEAHLYRLFGVSFPLVGALFFSSALLLFLLFKTYPATNTLYNLLLGGGAAAEINMILLQKNVIKAWCPVCLAKAGSACASIERTATAARMSADTWREISASLVLFLFESKDIADSSPDG